MKTDHNKLSLYEIYWNKYNEGLAKPERLYFVFDWI